MKNQLMHLVSAIGLAAAIAFPAQATPITGDISFIGQMNLTGGSDIASSTGIDFVSAIVNSGTGDFSGVPALQSGPPPYTFVTFTDFSFASFPAAGVTALWSFSAGGTDYSFNLESLTVDIQDADHLYLSGAGALSITGLDSTAAKWAFSTQTGSGILSFSADNSATSSVPEPSSVALLAAGILGLGLTRRLNRKP